MPVKRQKSILFCIKILLHFVNSPNNNYNSHETHGTMDVIKRYWRSDTLPNLNKKLEVPTFLHFKNAVECAHL